MNKRRFTISGIDHILRMMQQYPQLKALASLTPINEVAKKASEAVRKSGCNCSASPVYAANLNVFARALDMTRHGDHLIIKNILKIDELCFYVKDNSGKSTLHCV